MSCAPSWNNTFASLGEFITRHEGSYFVEVGGGVFLEPNTSIERRCLKNEILSSLESYRTPPAFSLTSIPKEKLLLTDQTTVSVENTEVPPKLFFALLRNTRMDIGKNISIFGQIENETGIEERHFPLSLKIHGDNEANTNLVLENIDKIQPRSIGIDFIGIELLDTVLISLLPKLDLKENGEVKELILCADKKEQVSAILTQNEKISVGRIKKIVLREYALAILPELDLEEVGNPKELYLCGSEKEHVAVILKQEEKISVRGVKKIVLRDYAVAILSKLGLEEVGELGGLSLYGGEKEHVAAILKQEKKISVRGTKEISLVGYAVNILPRLDLEEVGNPNELYLCGGGIKDVAAIIAQKEKISVRGVKKIVLRDYAVAILPRLDLEEVGELEGLSLFADEKEHVAAILAKKEKIPVRGVKEISLVGYAASVLPRLDLREDGGLKELKMRVCTEESHCSEIFEQEDESIDVWDAKIKIAIYAPWGSSPSYFESGILSKLKRSNIAERVLRRFKDFLFLLAVWARVLTTEASRDLNRRLN
ncbi:MAG: uncharacterized protein A8A55_0474 [Amphiamblys sp. WSBS2006]|nr:MAG: uncharacterized protein A8A55_0474 [Amphiamblys sp. WSBS2006]